MGIYDERPWLASYAQGLPADITPEFNDAVSMFAAAVAAVPDRPAITYFDGEISFSRLDDLSDGFAAALQSQGVQAGDRVALFLQNVPQFVIALLATWKAGGVAVAINPMSRERELTYQLQDSGATVLVFLESLYGSVAQSVLPSTAVTVVVTTSELDYQTRNDPRLFGSSVRQRHEGTHDLTTLIETFSDRTPSVEIPDVGDAAVLTYTSGTTGPPKGAMTSHGNITFNAQVYRDWMSLTDRDAVLAVAPLFHITGMIGHIAVALLARMPLVLCYRFDPAVALDVSRERRPTFTVGAVTVFTALLHAHGVSREDFASFRLLYSGGAPISPTAAQKVHDVMGLPLHNIYGLTETTSPSHAVPPGAETPVDEASGALSVGVPVPNTVVRIVDEDGKEL